MKVKRKPDQNGFAVLVIYVVLIAAVAILRSQMMKYEYEYKGDEI